MNIPADYIQQQVKLALAEDIGHGDVTAELLPAEQQSTASVIAREDGILCGTQWFDEVFHQLDAGIEISWLVRDTNAIKTNQTLCTLCGPTRALLSGERAALNFLQTLSGTASIARQYSLAMGTTKAQLLDTRKTIPGLRLAQKYAVRCGGGGNHRIGLFDMILIKENHIASQGGVTAAMQKAIATAKGRIEIEIEVENLNELKQALAAGAKRILLDNFDLDDLREAVSLTGDQAELEASGNITLENIHDVATTGVDYISTGAITKHVHALDLSMRLQIKE